MHKTAAMLRHRELTQEIYNIGDEVAEYTEHIAEAIADYDGELTDDCLAEFAEIVDDARQDARRIVGELIGLRQALTTGMRAGALSASASPEEKVPEPDMLDAAGLEDIFPLQAPFSVRAMHEALTGRTELVVQHLTEIVDFTLEQTEMVARELGAVSLPHLYARVGELVEAAVEGWMETVCVDHPAFTRTMRGMNPPDFLAERARIDAIVAKVAAKRSRRGA
ncbi:hypothetical protein [Corynebacterium timonense]|uniref:Uncharacterized protein n=1 Tax=Corynebacterium timonense TaxID=441500 RepID=A0A1H1M2S3_9CORY|nr:hypothetical protein [Corynebacterium timonense]SDR80645.1 hypothetical protein SAMN04488539_0408 [Corynebacterium timonense]